VNSGPTNRTPFCSWAPEKPVRYRNEGESSTRVIAKSAPFETLRPWFAT